MLRVLLLPFFYLLFAPLTLFFSSAAALWGMLGLGQSGGDWAARNWSRCLTFLAGIRIQADLSGLDPARNYVFLCNHQSNFDIPILFRALAPWRIKFVAKKSLFDIPIFGRAMLAAGHLPMDRENRREAMKNLETAVAQARAGASTLIFPEGTRHPDPESEDLQDFKIGGMILALKCGLPVAPLVLTGSGRLLPKGRAILSPGTVRIKALPVLDSSAYDLKEREKFKDDLRERMNAAYRELRRGG